jgi:hypothetical protein
VKRISHFYRIFHTANLAEDRIELLLNCPVPPEQLAALNSSFEDLVDQGTIQATEACDAEGWLRPAFRFHFNKRRIGRLYQFLDALNGLALPAGHALQHPGQRQPTSTA